MTARLKRRAPATRGRLATLEFVGDEASNWDGGPQPALLALAERGQVKGPILEAGCGTGENALALAGWGKVVGVDSSATAILAARRKAQERAIPAFFLQRDVTRHMGLRYRFKTVVDSGLFHGLDGAGRIRYAQQLARLVEPGGRVHVLCFSQGHGPRVDSLGVRRTELPTALGAQFVLTSVRSEPFMLTTGPRDAWLASYERVPKESRRRPPRVATPVVHGGPDLLPPSLVTRS